jgi:hypothetical protein
MAGSRQQNIMSRASNQNPNITKQRCSFWSISRTAMYNTAGIIAGIIRILLLGNAVPLIYIYV